MKIELSILLTEESKRLKKTVKSATFFFALNDQYTDHPDAGEKFFFDLIILDNNKLELETD